MLSAINTGFYNALKLYPETWQANTAYTIGDLVKASVYNAHTYKCTTAGTSHSSEPTWGTTNGGATTDGSTLVWTCYDGKIYQVKAPQGSTVPYVTFGLLTNRPLGDFGDSYTIEDLTFWVNAFSDKSTADVAEITDEVMTAMDGATLTVSGYNHLTCRREFMGSIIWDSETGIYQIPLRYRVWENKA